MEKGTVFVKYKAAFLLKADKTVPVSVRENCYAEGSVFDVYFIV